MPNYYIYTIGADSHVLSRHDCDAPDDLSAVERAKELCNPHEVEVWQLGRLVARLAIDGTPSLRPDSAPRI